jgi:hypothetical protein
MLYEDKSGSRRPSRHRVHQQTCALLMEYADRIGDEEMRNSFLENVPWHRKIVALARGTAPA